MSFMDIVSKFNQQADSHSKTQSLNPFSEQFQPSRSPSPRFSREEYGKPIAGSKTDLRGRKAKSHICREILELCTVIHDVGTYNSKKRDPDDNGDDDGEDDGTIIVSFGELFQIYTKISDKVVGLLIAAKRRGFVYFDREILFQRRDDDVLIALLKPITEISKLLKEDINQASGVPAAPVETKPVEKNKSTSSNKTRRVKPECDKIPIVSVNDQTKVISEEVVDIVINDDDDHKRNCNKELNGVVNEEVVNNIIDISENTEDYSVRGIDDETKTDKTDATEIDDESKIEEFDKTKTEETVGTKTDEIDEIRTEEIDDTKIEDTNDIQIDDTDELKPDETIKTEIKEITEKSDETVIEKIIENETFKTEEINDNSKNKKPDEINAERTDEIKVEESNESNIEETNESEIEDTNESKTDEIDETKTELTDKTKTGKTDKINGFSVDIIENNIKSIDLANIDGEVQEEVEENDTYVKVYENHLVVNVIEESIEEVSIGIEIE